MADPRRNARGQILRAELEQPDTRRDGPGADFRDPAWADDTFVFGYPPVPTLNDAYLTVQRGEVVNPSAETTFRESCFLYSAVTRPGNSGGPIVAGDGRVIGIVAHDAFDKARGEQARFFRGIPANTVVGALAGLGLAHLTTLEDWS